MQGNEYSPVVVAVEINDSNWFRQFIGIFIWFAYWLAVTLTYIIYAGDFLRYSSPGFLIGAVLILYAIVVKNGFLYRVGFYIYLVYALIVTAYDVLIVLFIWVFLDWYEKMIGAALDIPTEDDNDADIGKAKEITGLALFGFRCLITFAFALAIITEIIFICILRSKIKIFDAYEKYRLNIVTSNLPLASPV